MKKLARTTLMAVAATATVFVSVSAAYADHRGWRHRGPVYVERHHPDNDGLALGVIGLAAGAVIGSAIADSRNDRRVYIDPVPAPTYYPPAPTYTRPVAVYQPSYEPWTAAWYDYCADRYRSFNPNTGTFRGYDGREHFCTAN